MTVDLSAAESGPSNVLIGDSDSITVTPTGAKTTSPARLDVDVRRDSTAYWCAPYHLFVVGAETGTEYGHTYLADSMGVDCFDSVSIPLARGYTGQEKVRLLAMDGDTGKATLRQKGLTPENAWRASDPFDVISTEEGRDSGRFQDEEKSVAEQASGFFQSAGIGQIEGIAKWGTLGAITLTGLYVGWPLLVGTRSALEQTTEN